MCRPYSKYTSWPTNVLHKKEKNCPGRGFSPGSHAAFCCHVSSASFNLENFCGISVYFVTLKHMSHLFYKTFLNWDLSISSWLRWCVLAGIAHSRRACSSGQHTWRDVFVPLLVNCWLQGCATGFSTIGLLLFPL